MNIYSLLSSILAIVSLAVGILLLTRSRKKTAAYALGGAAILQSLMAFSFFMALRWLPSGIDMVYLRGSLVFASLNPILVVLFSFHHIQMPFPFFRGFKKVAVPAVSFAGILFSLYAFNPGFLQAISLVSGKWIILFGPVGAAFSVYLILSLLVIFQQMEQTYRAIHGIQRERLKFLLLGITSGSLYSLFLGSILLLYHSIHLDLLLAGFVVYAICWGMISFAVIRHRLLKVDIFVSRHVVYTSVAAFGVGLYLLVIGILGYLVRSIGGRWDLLLTATFVSFTLILLAVFLLSSNLQKRLKRFVNVHFYRYKYDYRLEWNEFTRKISEAHDLPNLLLKIIEMITETLWVNQVSIWLYNERSGDLCFSKSRNLPKKAELLREESPLVQYLLHHSEPLESKDPDVQNILSRHEDFFKRFKIAMVVPLRTGDQLEGMITLSGVMNGGDYSEEDYELLKIIAHQAAGAIASAKWIEEVAVTKETESFHKISSFLVHDMKNLVSSISLVLQNAEQNMDKPEFQKDLLSTLLNTVDKMKELIEKLSTLPKKLEIKKNPVHINRLITEVLESTKAGSIKGLEILTDLNDLPQIQADAEYVKKVLVNLTLNAIQSLPAGRGRIEVSSYSKNGCVHVEFLDNGIGMTEEFIRSRLFKPFISTKKKGLGIGLYQCKTIMEAHGGDIEVSSIPNRGSQFVLKFPLG